MTNLNTKTIYDVAFKAFNGMYLAGIQDPQILTEQEFATFVKNLEGYGYTLSPSLAQVVHDETRLSALDSIKGIMDVLARKLGDKGYKPFYPGFPKEVMGLSDVEFYLNAMAHYLLGWRPDQDNAPSKKEDVKNDIKPLTALEPVTKEQLIQLAQQYLTSNVALSESDLEDLLVILEFLDDDEVQKLMESSEIKIKETLTAITLPLMERGLDLSHQYKTATDVLRFIISLNQGVKQALNARHVEFPKLSRRQLRSILGLLEGLSWLADDFIHYKKVWKNFFKLNSGKIRWKEYPKTQYAKDILFGEHTYTTKRGELEKRYVDAKAAGDDLKISQLVPLLRSYESRPGDFARQLLSLLALGGHNYFDLILARFSASVADVNSRVLYQMLDRVTNLNQANVHRIVSVEGALLNLDETHHFTSEEMEKVKNVLVNELKTRYAKREFLGKVYLDESYKNIALTTSQKGASETLHPITTGSRVPFNKKADVLRFFVGWKNLTLNGHDHRVDIDLSSIAYDKNFNEIGTVSYYAREVDNILFSGDIVDAPAGACEYIDITSINELVRQGVRYIGIHIYDYTGLGFDVIHNVFGGVMELSREAAEEGKLHYAQAITNGYSIQSHKTSTNLMLIDLVEGYYIWVDRYVGKKLMAFTNYHNSRTKLMLPLYYQTLISKKQLSMYDVILWNIQTRGVLTQEMDDADVVFPPLDHEHPLPLAEIMAEYI